MPKSIVSRRFIIDKIMLHDLVQIAFASKLISSGFSKEIPSEGIWDAQALKQFVIQRTSIQLFIFFSCWLHSQPNSRLFTETT